MTKQNADGNQNPEGERTNSPSELSSELGLASGLPAGFFERDDPENTVDPETPDETAEAATEDGEPAVEDQDAEGEKVTSTPAQDPELIDLQRKYAEAETERLRRAEEQRVVQEQLRELQPLLDLGAAVRDNPELYQMVAAKLRGEANIQAPTQKKAAKMSPKEFVEEVVRKVTERIVPEVEDRITRANTSQRAAERKFNEIDAKANKEIPNFDIISRHPKFLRFVKFYSDGLMDPNNPWNPGKDDPQFWAVKQAAEAVIKDNPEYIKALQATAVKQASVKAEQKAAASSIGKVSRTVPQKKRELTEEEQDRLAMVQSRLKRGSMRRLPSAKR